MTMEQRLAQLEQENRQLRAAQQQASLANLPAAERTMAEREMAARAAMDEVARQRATLNTAALKMNARELSLTTGLPASTFDGLTSIQAQTQKANEMVFNDPVALRRIADVQEQLLGRAPTPTPPGTPAAPAAATGAPGATAVPTGVATSTGAGAPATTDAVAELTKEYAGTGRIEEYLGDLRAVSPMQPMYPVAPPAGGGLPQAGAAAPAAAVPAATT